MVISFWERERERQSVSVRRTEREGGTESETSSRLWAISTEPHEGLELTNHEIMTWAKVRRLTHWATQAPQFTPLFDSSLHLFIFIFHQGKVIYWILRVLWWMRCCYLVGALSVREISIKLKCYLMYCNLIIAVMEVFNQPSTPYILSWQCTFYSSRSVNFHFHCPWPYDSFLFLTPLSLTYSFT